jgi:hypothetical protein
MKLNRFALIGLLLAGGVIAKASAPYVSSQVYLDANSVVDGTQYDDHNLWASGNQRYGPAHVGRTLTQAVTGGNCSATESVLSNYGVITDTTNLKATAASGVDTNMGILVGYGDPSLGTSYDTLIIGSKAVGSTPALKRGTMVVLHFGSSLNGYVDSGSSSDGAIMQGLYDGNVGVASYGLAKGQYDGCTLFTNLYPPSYGIPDVHSSVSEVQCWIGSTVTITSTLSPQSLAGESYNPTLNEGGGSLNVNYNATLRTYVSGVPAGVTVTSLSGTNYVQDPADVAFGRWTRPLWTNLLPNAS